jgi:tellurite resistance protein
MLSWVMSDPQFYLRTPATRDFALFRELFGLRWDHLRPDGVSFTETQIARFPKLKSTYRAASGSFTVDVQIGEDLPDVRGARQAVTRAHEIALRCCDELDAYSRLIGRRPELKGSIGAGAWLPADTKEGRAARDALTLFAARSQPTSAGDVLALLEGGAQTEKVTTTQWRKAGEALAALGYGIAPDLDLALIRVEPALPCAIFALPAGTNEVTAEMSAIALVLQIGSLIAVADGVVTLDERDELHRAADAPDFDLRQKAKLRAQADWMLGAHARPSDLKARLAKASPQTRALVVDVALDMARRDGHVSATEVRQLENVFGWLGLPAANLYSALNEGGLVEVTGPVVGPAGEAIPSPAPKRRRLDAERIAKIALESAKSAALLQSVFSDNDQGAAVAEMPQPQAVNTIFTGLSSGMATFAQALCERDAWPRAELVALALAHDTMLDGAVDRLNEWALDRWGDLLVDEGDPSRINRTLLSQAVEA